MNCEAKPSKVDTFLHQLLLSLLSQAYPSSPLVLSSFFVISKNINNQQRNFQLEEQKDKKMNNGGEQYSSIETQYIRRHHKHDPRDNQCSSALVKHIKAPVHLVSFFSLFFIPI